MPPTKMDMLASSKTCIARVFCSDSDDMPNGWQRTNHLKAGGCHGSHYRQYVLGKIWDHNHLDTRLLHPVVVGAGVVDADGKAKYTGLHAFRHFYASWLINRKADGGLELPIKTVQQRLGHSSIMMTSDVYGHLFPRTDDGRELAEAERGLMAVS